MKITKEMMKEAYSVNRAIQRLYYEKQPLRMNGLAYRVIKETINELQTEFEKFPLRLQVRVQEMQDARDFGKDVYDGANWTKKWIQYPKITTTRLTDGDILAFARMIRARQANINPDVFSSIPY